MNQKLLILLFVFIGFVTSCSDENELDVQVPEETIVEKATLNDVDFTVVDGVLSFNSSEDFFALGEKLVAMSTEQFSSWEKEVGFVSLRSEIESSFDKLDVCETIEEYESVLKENDDIIKIQDELESPVIESFFYQNITNRKGYYIVEGILHKITSDGLYITENKSFESIEDAIIKGIESNSLDVEFRSLNSGGLLKSSNSEHSVYDWTNWHSRRKCYAELKIDEASSGQNPRSYKFYVTCQSKSYGRTLVGSKKNVSSHHYCNNFDYKLMAPIHLWTCYGTPSYEYEVVNYEYKGICSYSDATSVKWRNYVPVGCEIKVNEDVINEIGEPNATIESVHAEFWTSGTTADHAATLDYN